jgi:hypothetical protein
MLPVREGDRVIITVGQAGGRLVVSCAPAGDWRAPERMKP